jgi:hypothetical protein
MSFASWNIIRVDIGLFDSAGYISTLEFTQVYDSFGPDAYEYAVSNLAPTDMTINSFYDVITSDQGYVTHTSLEPSESYMPTITYLEATIDNTQAVAYSENEGLGLRSKFGFTSGSTVQDMYDDTILELIEDYELELNPTRQTFRRLSPGTIGPHNLMSFGSWRLRYAQESQTKSLLRPRPPTSGEGGY